MGPPSNPLTLRPTVIGGERVERDFTVYCDGRPIGRIREAHERVGHNPGWDWAISVPLPVPTWSLGSAEDLDRAKVEFRASWERFHATLTSADVKHWYHHQDATAAR
jgi:hypothetical protein